jgi:hypothetical protein
MPFRETLEDYRSRHGCGKRVLLTVNSDATITRIIWTARKSGLPLSQKRSLFRSLPKPDLTDAFPVDVSDYAIDFRRLDDTSVLACAMPVEFSLALAGLLKDMGLIPLRVDAYANCVSLALERRGENAVCVMSNGIIYAAGGSLREMITPAGARELEILLNEETGIKRAYNPVGYSWADEIFNRAGIEATSGCDLGLMGLLGTAL